MSDRIHALAQQLLGLSRVEDCDVQEIRSLVQKYPFYAPAQFLLLEKLRQEQSPEYTAQLHKAILYYHDPVAFQWFTQPDRFYTEDPDAVPEPDMAAIATSPESDDVNTVDPTLESSILVEHEEAEFESATFYTDEKGRDVEEVKEVWVTDIPDEEPLPVRLNLPSLSEPPVESKSDLTFEPFHTVDYFASQGIKLSQEEAGKDRFGKQLKSFTEWLKEMKKLPPKQMEAAVDARSESAVQHLADDSIHESEVYTEAMAEVWLKQGNKSKAFEVYNKLSLLNPSKKAYFAGKIEQLKQS